MMKLESRRSIQAEEIYFADTEDSVPHLRIVAPKGSSVAGQPIWYELSIDGWMALGIENFQEHEKAYQEWLLASGRFQ